MVSETPPVYAQGGGYIPWRGGKPGAALPVELGGALMVGTLVISPRMAVSSSHPESAVGSLGGDTPRRSPLS